MAEYKDREHYIPVRKSDLVNLLCADSALPPEDREPFRQFCRLITAVFHFEYLETLERLKEGFAPFDPDRTAEPITPLTAEAREQRLDQMFGDFVNLMARANYHRLSKETVQKAIEGGASDWGINMCVDFDTFARMEIFARGEGTSHRVKRHPILFWRKTEKLVDTYERLVLLLKLKPHKHVPKSVNTDDVFIKCFKDIPKLDLEMVLPGGTLQMPRGQRWKLGASLFGTLGYALWKIWTDILLAAKVIATGALTAAGTVLWGPFVLIAGYGYKQYYGYQFTKQTYSKMLTESLYYQTLDNNGGVLTRLLDEAEEQECREALLAYFCLWRFAPELGWTSGELDDYVESFLERTANLKVDFEIGDALDKVLRLGVVEKQGDRFRAASLARALERLDYRWDNYFQYNKG